MSTIEVRVCGTADVEPESHMQVQVPGIGAVAVYHVEGRFYVTDDSRARRCTTSLVVVYIEVTRD